MKKPEGQLFTRCPKCLADLVVTDSRPKVNSFRRRRECPNGCLERFTTIEITQADYDELKLAVAGAAIIVGKIRECLERINPEILKLPPA